MRPRRQRPFVPRCELEDDRHGTLDLHAISVYIDTNQDPVRPA